MFKNLNIDKKEGYLLTDKLYRKYFSGIDVDEGYLLISDKMIYFADARYFSALKDKLSNLDIILKLYENNNSIKKEINEQGLKTIYLDYESTTLAENESYLEYGVQLKNGTKNLQKCREIKDEFEIESTKKACQIIEKTLNLVLPLIRTGITEKEIADFIENKVIELGAEGLSFETIVAFGKNAAVPHHETSEGVLKENQCILIDTGCKVNGYCSDITRTYFYGNPDDKFTDCYQAVKNANQLALDSISEQTSLSSIDVQAREYLAKFNLDKYFTHSLGHGVGLAIHEQPRLSKKAEGVFKENMIFTIEPGVYFDDEFGIRIEDTVLLKNNKALRLFSDSKELIIIDIKD